MATARSGAGSWTVVVPVKLLDTAKTRLARTDRSEVALAMARDAVAAAAACPSVHSVLVVTDDPRAAASVTDIAGLVDVVADEPSRGLNPALVHGAAVATQRRPDAGVAVLAADLPALRAVELERALDAAAGVERGLVADASGTGTVLLTAGPGLALQPRFGPDSRAEHRAFGADDLTERLADEIPGLRRDVDTVADLAEAAELGLGAATRLLAGSRPAAPTGATSVQATVRDWSDDRAAGTAVTDDGILVPLPPGSLLTGSLIRLRPGQRVRVQLSGEVAGGTGETTIGLVPEFD